MKKNNCYIHIPFCSSKCKYCRFASFWVSQKWLINKYITFLCKEIEKNNEKNNEKNSVLDTIYFGWWTPSILQISELENIINILSNKFNFSENIEITLETTSNNITENNIIWWKKLWINRLSIWVQSLNNKTLKEINRWSNVEILNALNLIEKIWFENISLDFIIWLPYVKNGEIVENINFLLSKYDFIKHISIYMLEEYYNIPEDKNSKFENIIYPKNWSKLWIKEEEFLIEYINIVKFLKQKWFSKYEISNFSRPWFECKHNKWYWNHKEMLAFWLWAHWFINWIRFSNSENFNDYYSFNNIIKEKITKNDLFIENIMFRLRTDWIHISNLKKLHKEKINNFLIDWFLIQTENKIILSDKWILVLDFILWEIL